MTHKHKKNVILFALLMPLAVVGVFSLTPTPTRHSPIIPVKDIATDGTNTGAPTTAAPLVPQEESRPSSSPHMHTAQQISAPKSSQGSLIATSDIAAARNYAAKHNLTVLGVTHTPDGNSIVKLEQPPEHDSVAAIKDQPFAASVSTNYTYRALYTLTNPDTHYASQWNIAKIAAPQAWDISTGSAATSIAIIDTGVLSNQTIDGTNYTQPDFPLNKMWTNTGETGATSQEGTAPNCTSRGLPLDKKCNNIDDDSNSKIDDWQGWDFMGGFNGNGTQCPNYQSGRAIETFVAEDNDPQPYSCDSPTNPSALNKTQFNGTCEFGVSACYIGHGTMVGSAATSATNNGQLVAGVDHNALVMNLRVLDGYGYTTTDRVAAAVRYAANNGADVINMSLAVSDCSSGFVDTVLEKAMADAKAKGVVIVAASGNEYLSSVCYPASSPHAIAVGASDQNDSRAGFSNFGPELDVVAPGVGIPVANAPSSAINNPYYPSASGTSLATPHVAGLAGLIKAARPAASADEIRKIIIERADPTTDMNGALFTNEFGHGRINAYTSTRVAQGTYRPIYQLYHPGHTCKLLTNSISERDIAVHKRGYLYQNIAFWLPRETNPAAYEPNTSTNMCAKP